MKEDNNLLRGKRLFVDTLIYAIGDLGPKAISFFLIPIYTAALNPTEYGTYDYIMTVFQVLSPIITMQIPGTIMRFIIKTSNEDKKRIITTGIIVSSYMIIFSILIAYTLLVVFSWNYYTFLLIIAMYVTNIYRNLFAQTLRGLGKVKLYAIVGLISTTLNLILSVIFVVNYQMSYIGIILGSIISCSISITIMVSKGRIHKYISYKEFDKEIMKDMLRYAIPLIPNSISWWVIGMSDRLIIKYYLGLDANGIYSVANKLSQIINLLYQTFNKAWIVSATNAFDSKNRDVFFSNVLNKINNLVFLSVGGILVFVPQIMSLWVSDAYYIAWKYSVILIVSMIFYCFAQFYGVAYNCSKKTNIAFYSTLFAAITNLGLNLLLIKKFGLYAAAISTLVSYFALWIYRIYTTKEYFSPVFKVRLLLLNLLLIAVLAFSNYLLSPVQWLIKVISFLSIVYINRELLVIVLSYIFKKIKVKQLETY